MLMIVATVMLAVTTRALLPRRTPVRVKVRAKRR